jgi:rSAM/selenodomain-associated transferase 1
MADARSESLLIIFYRNPQLGKVKTRLAKSLGDANALAIYLRLVQHTRTVTESLPCDKVVYYSDYVDTEDAWKNEVFKKSRQQGSDLGTRMQHAFEAGFREGYQRICIIGTDCWELQTAHLQQAFAELERTPSVLGPAHDGGYYLLGLSRFHATFFQSKSWSTAAVADATRHDARQLGWEMAELPPLHDIDEPHDIRDSRLWNPAPDR